jgi:salicylate hydroxylase
MVAQNSKRPALDVLIVGAGLGGLACAIACRRADPSIKVLLIERTPEILPVGAGIQIPPNASRIMDSFGLSKKLRDRGGVLMEAHTLRRYEDGSIIVERPWTKMREEYGGDWL